jgi:AraC family transcriptional regulator
MEQGELRTIGSAPGGVWIQSVIGLLDTASRQLGHGREAAQLAIERATSLLRQQIRSRPALTQRGPEGLLSWQIRRIYDYVDAHITARLTVPELGSVVHLSEGHFSRCFKRTVGLTPHAFVLHRRLQLAARLMLESSAALADIAVRSGFTDQAHLCNQFKRAVGESPAEWRRAHRAEQRFASAWLPPIGGISRSGRIAEAVRGHPVDLTEFSNE